LAPLETRSKLHLGCRLLLLLLLPLLELLLRQRGEEEQRKLRLGTSASPLEGLARSPSPHSAGIHCQIPS